MQGSGRCTDFSTHLRRKPRREAAQRRSLAVGHLPQPRLEPVWVPLPVIMRGAAPSATAAGGAPPVEAGEQTIQAQVQITYELRSSDRIIRRHWHKSRRRRLFDTRTARYAPSCGADNLVLQLAGGEGHDPAPDTEEESKAPP